MAHSIELSSLDLRYESYRVREPRRESTLLAKIAERGIEEPLWGVAGESGGILLDGFKRYRCAKKLNLEVVPFISAGADEAAGILSVLKGPTRKRTTVLEEARFIRDLKICHNMTVADIAEALGRSKGWVSMRLSVLEGMSEAVGKKIFSGAFPAYSYMYIVRKFMRMNSIEKGEVETFVQVVSGNKLSLRDIEQLANGYFRGPQALRREIADGKFALVLEEMEQVPQDTDGCSEFERIFLADLERLGKTMQQIMGKANDSRAENKAFHAQAHLVLAGVLSRMGTFTETMRRFYDRCGDA